MSLAEEIYDLVVTNCDLECIFDETELQDLLGQIQEKVTEYGADEAFYVSSDEPHGYNKASHNCDTAGCVKVLPCQ